MSHFSVLAIVPDEIMRKDGMYIREFIEINMSKYDEAKEVKPYDRECFCVFSVADTKARKAVERKLGKFEEIKSKYETIKEEIRKKYGLDKINVSNEWLEDEKNQEIWEQSEKEQNEAWKKLTKPFYDLEDKFRGEYRKKAKPMRRCITCRGSGIEKGVTYNPNSKWDWYRVGGRWDGMLLDNFQSSEDGFNFNDKHETIKNNGIKVKELLKKIEPKNEKDRKKYLTYAILNKDGEWIGRGKMGWWGMSSGDKDNWDEIFINVLKKADKDDWGIILDCHI